MTACASSAWKLPDVLPVPKARMIEDFNKDLRPTSFISALSKAAEIYAIDNVLKLILLTSLNTWFYPSNQQQNLHLYLYCTSGYRQVMKPP